MSSFQIFKLEKYLMKKYFIIMFWKTLEVTKIYNEKWDIPLKKLKATSPRP